MRPRRASTERRIYCGAPSCARPAPPGRATGPCTPMFGRLSVFRSGSFLVESEATVGAMCSESLPRVGLEFRMPRAAVSGAVWSEAARIVTAPIATDPASSVVGRFGRGPHENYPDRKQAADVGVHAARLDELSHDYVRCKT